MEGLEVLPERVRWVSKPAMGEGVSGEEVAELVMNARLGYPSENRQEGAGGKRQESNQQKGDRRASQDRQEPAEEAFGMVLAAGFLRSRITRISPTNARVSRDMLYWKPSNDIHENGLIKAGIEPYRQTGVYPTPPCTFGARRTG